MSTSWWRLLPSTSSFRTASPSDPWSWYARLKGRCARLRKTALVPACLTARWRAVAIVLLPPLRPLYRLVPHRHRRLEKNALAVVAVVVAVTTRARVTRARPCPGRTAVRTAPVLRRLGPPDHH